MSYVGRAPGLTLAVAALMIVSSLFLFGGATLTGASHSGPGTTAPSPPSPTSLPGTSSAAAVPGPAGAVAPVAPAATSAFDARVARTAIGLGKDGVPADRIRLPYVGLPAELVNGVVVPGVARAGSPVTPYASTAPAPSGIAYYGENDSNGTIGTTTLDASSVAGSVTVNQLNSLYLDTDTPDQWGIQLNAVETNVTLQGHRGYDFWVQNTVDYIQHNDTLNFGEDTWNFSGPSATIPNDTSTIASHNPNGSVAVGLYIGEGPYVYAPRPFSLTLYLNSSVTPSGLQVLWYNYTLSSRGGPAVSANYDSIEFNSSNAQHPGAVGPAPFEASGSQIDPAGSPDDFELDYGIGSFDGSTNDVLAANVTATLDYCPASTPQCASTQFQSVPAAEDFGGETGETGSGLGFSYLGTTEIATAGPFILRGLWGYGGEPAANAGSTAVTNAITFSGAPDGTGGTPYVFVFFNTSATPDSSLEWAPDVPVWHLAPGTYGFAVLLSDYQERQGTLVVGNTPTALSLSLVYNGSTGVYTPLWAFNNSALAGLSTSGDGTLAHQYTLFNNSDAGCTDCGGATNGNLSGLFGGFNDWFYPSFVGALFVGTDAYAVLAHPVSFSVPSVDPQGFYPAGAATSLQIELVSARHVTLSDDPLVGGWPMYFQLTTFAGYVPASSNPFPQAEMVLWNSSDNLLRSNTFVPYPDCYGLTDLLMYGGTGNTVWGNTFEDAPGGYGIGCFAGLAESESGDLIYNNLFSVDNPTVYLPFDIYNDSCGAGYSGQCGPMVVPHYADTWNVSLQPASDVSATVNGFPLSGDILGAGCSLQGGNFWSTYGNSLNNYSTLPFVNRYDYALLAPDFGPSFAPNQNSILVGGDYLPLTPHSCSKGPVYPVRFYESGLTAGTAWSVKVDGQTFGSTDRWINVTLPNGTYNFHLPTVANFSSASGGSFTVAGKTVRVSERFDLVHYRIILRETGLAHPPSWSVQIGSVTYASSNDAIRLKLANGTYAYTVTNVTGYTVSTNGMFTVAGGTLTVTIHFSPARVPGPSDAPARTPTAPLPNARGSKPE
jgi:thermopsin